MTKTVTQEMRDWEIIELRQTIADTTVVDFEDVALEINYVTCFWFDEY